MNGQSSKYGEKEAMEGRKNTGGRGVLQTVTEME